MILYNQSIPPQFYFGLNNKCTVHLQTLTQCLYILENAFNDKDGWLLKEPLVFVGQVTLVAARLKHPLR